MCSAITATQQTSALFGHVMKRGSVKYVSTMRRLEAKRGRKKAGETMLNILASWYAGIICFRNYWL